MTLLIEKILFHLINYSSSYLIYVGTTIISIEYLFRRKWIKSIILFLIGLVWVGSYYSLVSFLGQLGVDSFHEVHNFDVQEAIFWFETFFFQFFMVSGRLFGSRREGQEFLKNQKNHTNHCCLSVSEK